MSRQHAFGQTAGPTTVDRVGRWMSLRAVRKWLATSTDSTCADLGCGYTADLARYLFAGARGITLLDLDVDRKLEEIPGVTIIRGSLPESMNQIQDESFDVILANNVLEHIWHDQMVLDEIFRVLKRGGRAAINVPSWRGKFWLEKAAFKWGLAPAEEMNDHKKYYDPRELWPMLIRSGFIPSQVVVKRHKLGLNTIALVQRGS